MPTSKNYFEDAIISSSQICPFLPPSPYCHSPSSTSFLSYIPGGCVLADANVSLFILLKTTTVRLHHSLRQNCVVEVSDDFRVVKCRSKFLVMILLICENYLLSWSPSFPSPFGSVSLAFKPC